MKSNDKILIVVALVGGITALAITVGFVGQGNVRHVPIFWTEKVEQTIVFEESDGKTHIKAIKGVSGEKALWKLRARSPLRRLIALSRVQPSLRPG